MSIFKNNAPAETPGRCIVFGKFATEYKKRVSVTESKYVANTRFCVEGSVYLYRLIADQSIVITRIPCSWQKLLYSSGSA